MRITFLRISLLFAILLPITVSPAARAADNDPIQNAIKKGAKYLQGVHAPDKNYAGGSHGMGSATLSGLALLEAGVPDTDPAVKNITTFVRNNALAQTRTYELSLTIMFLDRLGQQADEPIIQFLGTRLMAGQGKTGGWSYDCGYEFTPQDEARLKNMFIKESRLVSTTPKKDMLVSDPLKKEPNKNVPRPDIAVDPAPMNSKNNSDNKDPTSAPKAPHEKPALHPEVVRWARLINQNPGQNGGILGGGDGDNSNTQFAALGLWCARKHGLPCEKSLALLETRFRTSQDADGGWSYHYQAGGGGSTATMTCAGLIALAVGKGAHQAVLRNNPNLPVPKAAHNDPKKGQVEPAEDAAIKNGLKCLGNYITQAKGMPPEGKINPARRGPRFRADNLNSNLYFLWSLERVGVIYGVDTIGNHDWYIWGADPLVDTQQANGCWASFAYHGANEEISTTFALLFLSRANVARDLTETLQGKFRDPGVAMLRGGDLAKILPERDPAKLNPMRDPVAAIEPRPGPVQTKPPAMTESDANAEAGRLAVTLLNASADARSGQLTQLRDNKGSVCTEALARAAGQAMGEFQQDIREALARRLTRMTAGTLREMLKDENREIRRGAAIACGRKEDKQFIPDLIADLTDGEDLVVQGSRTSLRSLTGKDFGPAAGETGAERTKARVAWNAWWKTQNQ